MAIFYSVFGFIQMFSIYFVHIVDCDVHVVPIDFNLNYPIIPLLSDPPVRVYSSGTGNLSKGIENNQLKRRISERKCEEYTLGTRCEFSQNDFDPNLNEEARVGQFPHMAFLGRNSTNPESVFVCSGSLISPRYVLTAANCLTIIGSPIEFVSLGHHNTDPTVDDKTVPVTIRIKNIHKHPNYNDRSLYNDIALLELDSDVTFSSKIRPACLWTAADIAQNTRAIVSSITYPLDKSVKSKDMRKVSVLIARDRECNMTLKRFIKGGWEHGLAATQFCGREAFANSTYCKALLGSPMQVVTQDKKSCVFHVVGVSSFGFAPSCVDYPRIFTRVSSYLDWIESLVWTNE